MRASRAEALAKARVVVLTETSRQQTPEDSQSKEGLNVKWFSISEGMRCKADSPGERKQEEKGVNTRMIEQVVHPYNLQRALEHVMKNGGSAGVDGIR